MSENQDLLSQLEELLHWKKSKKFYADKLSVTEATISKLLHELRGQKYDNDISTYIKDVQVDDGSIMFAEDFTKGTGEITFDSKEEIKTLEELITKCDIDVTKWDIVKYVQNYWGNVNSPHWQVKAWLSKKSTEQTYQDVFVDFLSHYAPLSKHIYSPEFNETKPLAALIINKQDAHLNKYDIDGDNDIIRRFHNIINKIGIIVNQAVLANNLEHITYILGSDEFNSEWTNSTTKGTPQENIQSYHTSFEDICNFEVALITMLLEHAQHVDIIFVSGNHDEFVGWHMVNWLKTYFRETSRISFDISPKYRKYVSYGNSAMMFNHGDSIKSVKLAGLFPMEFKEHWSKHENFYIFTGDKHHEVTQDINGIKFYQLPAFSKAKSLWDDKNGYTCSKAEATGFLIDKYYGITNIFKQYL